MLHHNRSIIALSIAALSACSDGPVALKGASLVTQLDARATTGLDARTVSRVEIAITWPDLSSNETGYEIHRASAADGTFTRLTTTGANSTSYTNGGLQPGTQYCYKVRTSRVVGRNTNYGAFSNTDCDTTQPSLLVAPSRTEAMPQNSSAIQVSWSDNNTVEGGFRVEGAGSTAGPWTLIATTGPNVTSTSDWVLPEEQHCYRVIAFDAVESSAASAPDCTAAPAMPGPLSAKANGGVIDLAWSDNSNVEDGYRVMRSTDFETWSELALLPAGATSYSDASIAVDVRYIYQVEARKDGGSSDPSYPARALVASGPPGAPANAIAWVYTDANDWSVLLNVAWTTGSANTQTFRIQRSLDGGTSWQDAVIVDWASTLYTESPTYEERVCFRIVAANDKGESAPSNVTCTALMYGPSALNAVAADYRTVDLSWTDNSLVESAYLVLRSTSYDGAFSVIAELPADATSYRDAGLSANQEYWYVVVAKADDYWFNNAYNYSNYATVMTPLAGAAQRVVAGGTRAGPAVLLKRGARQVLPRVQKRR